MPTFSEQPSYVAYDAARKRAFFCILLGLLAAQVGLTSTLSPSLATSVSVLPYSAASPSVVAPTQTTLRFSFTASPSPPQSSSFQISIQLTSVTWSEDLLNRSSSGFAVLAKNLTAAVSHVLKNVGNASVHVVEFKPGSVIAVLKVTASSTAEPSIKTQLADDMSDRDLGGFSVDPNLYSGSIFDVDFKVKFACNNSAVEKGFDQKGDFENALSTVMSSDPKYIAFNITHIECLKEDNITLITARFQINEPTSPNPNKILKNLKNAVDAGKVGNISVVPEWKSFIPGEKLFHIIASLKSESSNSTQTKMELETTIVDAFKVDKKFKYFNIGMPSNKTVVIDIGMSSQTSELPSQGLSPLDSAMRSAKIGSIKLLKPTIRVTVDPKSLITRKIFEVTFFQNVPSCIKNDTADKDTELYKNLSMGFWQFIDGNIKANGNLKPLYVETKVRTLKCHNLTTVRGVSDVYMRSNTEDKIGQILGPLYKCKKPGIYDWGIKVLLKTPTRPDTRGNSVQLSGVYIHLVCLRPKPPTPAPTTEPPSQDATRPALTTRPETSKPTTIKATFPTLGRKPDLYVELKLGMTWGELCPKQETLKEQIASNVHDKSGTKLSADRIVYVNVAKNCADPSKKNEQAEVWFYVSKSGTKEVHKCLTLKAYKVFLIFFENGNTKQLGPDFEEKVIKVELAGNDASKYETNDDNKVSSLTVILIAVGGAVGLFLMLMACCCLYCCGKRRRRRSQKYDSESSGHALHVIHVDNGEIASAGTKGKQNRRKEDSKGDGNKKSKKRDDGANMKGDMDKSSHINGGYDDINDFSANNNNSLSTDKNAVGNESYSDIDNKYADEKASKHLNDDQGNTYSGLKTTDHTYASVNKPGGGKESSGDKGGNDYYNTPVSRQVPPAQPVPTVGSGRGGMTADSTNKGDGSPRVNSPRTTVPVIVPSASPVPTVGSRRGGVTADSTNKRDGSPRFNSSRTNVPVISPSPSLVPTIGSRNVGIGANNINAKEGSSGVASGNDGEHEQNRGSQPSTPVSLSKPDSDSISQARRGSRGKIQDDEEIPLTHKTGTVGIVALAIRNKNGQKKETEFKNLNKNLSLEEVNYPPNTASKNRSPGVVPAPKTRVMLSTQPDYINANWVRDHKGKKCYIATQHPLHETVNDFWQMVWDQKANIVVMVNDKQQEKPAEFVDYLPKGEGSSKAFGSINVTVKQTTEKADYRLTVLSIADTKNVATPREVSHFRFTSWKERAIPNVALFVGFVTATRETRKKYGDTNVPTIVHCSDGLGFTGVYIAVDIGVKSHEESKTSVVDVFELSKNLRRDRHGIVCSLEHYNFIYQALYEYTVNYDKSDK